MLYHTCSRLSRNIVFEYSDHYILIRVQARGERYPDDSETLKNQRLILSFSDHSKESTVLLKNPVLIAQTRFCSTKSKRPSNFQHRTFQHRCEIMCRARLEFPNRNPGVYAQGQVSLLPRRANVQVGMPRCGSRCLGFHSGCYKVL